MKKPVRIAMVAGEASSDLLASRLIRALRQHVPHAQFYGIGGVRMVAEGFEALWPSERLSVHGYVEGIRRYRELSGIRRQLCAKICQDPPSALIGVDAPDFNLGLERQVKAAGIPAIHYISPSIWAWRGGRIRRIAQSVTHMLCLFPFEPAYYEKAGVPVTYVGHPLADEFPLHPNRAAARQKLGLPEAGTVFALLPGSRQSEVRQLGMLFIQTAERLQARYPQAQFLVPLATPETHALFEQMRLQHANESGGRQDLSLRVLDGQSWEAMVAADVVLVASGTASLEAALLKRPMVLTYKVGALSYHLYKRMAYLPWIGLPNILCGETVVPELLQNAATPTALADALAHWLEDVPARHALEAKFLKLHETLRQNTAHKAAQAILPYLSRSSLSFGDAENSSE